MDKEEAKKQIAQWFNPEKSADQAIVNNHLNCLIDAIEPDHKKVVLPEAVGEQWDKLVCYEEDSGETTKVDIALYDLSHNVHIDGLDTLLLFNWWRNTPGSYSALIDAAKYGWVAKTEKLYRVKVYGIDLPGIFYWKRGDGTLSFVQGGAGQKETEFTISEIEHLHLENCEREEVKGHAVAKDKKYNVKVPHTKNVWYYQAGESSLLTICPVDKELRGKFTESEIEHYGLQDCEKEEVTDDEQ
nr:DUF1642 domain-containing protein [Schleiferilactobacillus harbinensis]